MAFFDDAVNRLVDVDGEDEAVYLIGVGAAAWALCLLGT